jgi:Trp operon repressor
LNAADLERACRAVGVPLQDAFSRSREQIAVVNRRRLIRKLVEMGWPRRAVCDTLTVSIRSVERALEKI